MMISLPSALTLSFLLATSCGTTHKAAYDMTWTFEADSTCPTMRHVILHFVEYPAYSYGYCSNELARYLDTLSSGRVSVTFSIYDPSAQLGGGDPVAVGSLHHWRWEFAHMGEFQDSVTGQAPAHPWQRFRASHN